MVKETTQSETEKGETMSLIEMHLREKEDGTVTGSGKWGADGGMMSRSPNQTDLPQARADGWKRLGRMGYFIRFDNRAAAIAYMEDNVA